MQDHQGVHLEAQGDAGTGAGGAGIEDQVAVIVGDDFGKKIQVGGQVPFAQAVLGQFGKEAVFATQGPLVVTILVGAHLIFFLQAFFAERAADGVVPAEIIVDHGGKHPPHVRVQAVAPGQLEGVLAFQGVRGVVAFQQVFRVVHQQGQVGATFHVGKSQLHATAYPHRPVGAAGQDGGVKTVAHQALLRGCRGERGWYCPRFDLCLSGCRFRNHPPAGRRSPGRHRHRGPAGPGGACRTPTAGYPGKSLR